MKRVLVVVGVLLLFVSVICLTKGNSDIDEDCPCLKSEPKPSETLAPLPEPTTEEQMEWVCETYRQVVCTEYDERPCEYCLYPCILACFVGCSPLGSGWGSGCAFACGVACEAGCPECDYCVEWEIEEIVVCGWVLTE